MKLTHNGGIVFPYVRLSLCESFVLETTQQISAGLHTEDHPVSYPAYLILSIFVIPSQNKP
jgi:hypothetical protein